MYKVLLFNGYSFSFTGSDPTVNVATTASHSFLPFHLFHAIKWDSRAASAVLDLSAVLRH